MIFYGSRAVKIKTGQIINVDCPDCKKNTSMQYSVFGRYAHVYWIPLSPYKKITLIECNSCKSTFDKIYSPENIIIKLNRENDKHNAKYPAWMYSGIFLILALIGYGFYDSHQTNINEADYIKNPKAGDVYYIKLEENRYTTTRVDKATRTALYLTYNDYEIDLESDIDRLNEPKNYTTQKDTIGVLELQDHYRNKNIISIKRN